MMDAPRLLRASALVSCVIASAPACTSPANAPPQDRRADQAAPPLEDANTVAVTLPGGDAGRGRQAFLDLKCTTCHRAAGDTSLPAPVSAAPGPDLDRTLRLRPASEVATAIVAPSHLISLRVSAEVKQQLERMVTSPMGDFSEVITVRQLADLLAYLRSLEAGP